jgi:hypothetical protein
LGTVEQRIRDLFLPKPFHEGAEPELEETTRAVAFISLVVLIPALYADTPIFVRTLEYYSAVLPLIPVALSGAISVLIGALLFLIGASLMDIALPMDPMYRQRFYLMSVAAIGLGMLIVGVLWPSVIWELMLLMLYSLVGILGVYAIALTSTRLAYVVMGLVVIGVVGDSSSASGWFGPILVGILLLVFIECVDGHVRFTKAFRVQLRVLGSLDDPDYVSVARENFVIIQQRFMTVLAKNIVIVTAIAVAAISSVGIAAWLGGGSMPYSIEVQALSGMSVPFLIILFALFTFHIHRSGLEDSYLGRVAQPLEVGPAGPLRSTWADALDEMRDKEDEPVMPTGLGHLLLRLPRQALQVLTRAPPKLLVREAAPEPAAEPAAEELEEAGPRWEQPAQAPRWKFGKEPR